MTYGVKDKDTGKIIFPRIPLRHPLPDDQKTLYNYNKPKPKYFYGNINLDDPEGKNRWRDTDGSPYEISILLKLRRSLIPYFPSGGYVLREPVDKLSLKEARKKSIGKMVKVKNDGNLFGFRIRFGTYYPRFVYIYFERTDGDSLTYIIKDSKKLLLKQDVYDPYF